MRRGVLDQRERLVVVEPAPGSRAAGAARRSRAGPRRTPAGCRPRPVSASVSHSSVLPLRGVAQTRYEITAGRAPRAAPPARSRRRLIGLVPSSTRSGSAGGSYGSSMPVRPCSVPARAPAVQALGVALLAHLQRRVDVHLDERQVLLGVAARARARGASAYGETSATSTTSPASASIRAASPARRTFSARDPASNPRSPDRPWRRLSPSIR